MDTCIASHGYGSECGLEHGHGGPHRSPQGFTWWDDPPKVRDTEPAPALSGGISSSLSKAVMTAGGYELFDLAVVRVPTVERDTTIRLDADEFSVEIVEDYKGPLQDRPDTGITALTPMTKDGARLLGRMLIQWAGR